MRVPGRRRPSRLMVVEASSCAVLNRLYGAVSLLTAAFILEASGRAGPDCGPDSDQISATAHSNQGKQVLRSRVRTLSEALRLDSYAEAAEQTFSVDMLGEDVAIVARPVQYTWSLWRRHFAGAANGGRWTAAAGPLGREDLDEPRRLCLYWRLPGGSKSPHFQGTYSVDGGPPLSIPGQGSFSSPPQTVSVWRSITRNYADTCLQNPQGQGCPGVAPPPP